MRNREELKKNLFMHYNGSLGDIAGGDFFTAPPLLSSDDSLAFITFNIVVKE
ncbi:hypothetical protein [Alkalihalobacillus sp. TS-13]|uniref:hypothetical protein n=1 Tax=Alkalihalobacillus sp. TS-13 TaxID=2842455 RepID=UPI001C88A849|nr:hypothetical protein [Alkalihalobacillus sp. TS-13]